MEFDFKITDLKNIFIIEQIELDKSKIFETVINYIIKVNIDKNNGNYITRRYSDFYDLYSNLINTTSFLIPYLPEKDFTIKFINDDNIIQKRKIELQIFLNKLITNNNIRNNNHFLNFIEKKNLDKKYHKNENNLSLMTSKLMFKVNNIYKSFRLSKTMENSIFDIIRIEKNINFDSELEELKENEKNIKDYLSKFKKLNYNMDNLYDSLTQKIDSSLIINSDVNSILEKLKEINIEDNLLKNYKIKIESLENFKKELYILKDFLKNIINELNHINYQLNIFYSEIKNFEEKLTIEYNFNETKKDLDEKELFEKINEKYKTKIDVIFNKPKNYNFMIKGILIQFDNEENYILGKFSEIYNEYYK